GGAVGAAGGGQPERPLAVGDGLGQRQLAEGGAEPGGVDAAAVSGDRQCQAEEEGGLLLVAARGQAERLHGVPAGEDGDERLDGGRQPVAGDVGEGGWCGGCAPVCGQVRQQRLGV